MSSKIQFDCCTLPDDVLNGIHPPEQGGADKTGNTYFGIPEEILDGIHPPDDTDKKENKLRLSWGSLRLRHLDCILVL